MTARGIAASLKSAVFAVSVAIICGLFFAVILPR
jgi:hypothetical protein